MSTPVEPEGGVAGARAEETESRASTTGTIALVALLTIVWGSTFPAIKVVVSEMPVLTFRAICLVAGAAVIAALARWRGRSLAVTRGQLGWLAVLAVLNTLAWNVFTAYGLLYLPAGRAIIIGYTMPLWSVIASAIVLGEPVTIRKVVGLLLGFAGLAVLIGPELAAIEQAPLGVALVLAAAISWAFGVVLLKWRDPGLPTTVLAGWQLGLAALPLVVVAILVDDHSSWTLSREGWIALSIVVIGGMVVAHIVWFSIVRILPASIASITTLLIPVAGVIISALWLGERVGPSEVGALILVLAGLFVVLVLPALTRKPGTPGAQRGR